jgi:hypothetical protein
LVLAAALSAGVQEQADAGDKLLAEALLQRRQPFPLGGHP